MGHRLMFYDLCYSLGILLKDGLRLFTQSSYLDQDEWGGDNKLIPYHGQGLNRPPFNFTVTNIHPENIWVFEDVAEEIKRRYKLMDPCLIGRLRIRFEESNKQSMSKRCKLSVWKGFTSEFEGDINTIKLAHNRQYISVLLTDVRFSGEKDILADHIWLRIPIEHFTVLNGNRDTLTFTGTVTEYTRYNDIQHRFHKDTGISFKPER